MPQAGPDPRRRRSVTSRTATGSRASTAPPAPRSSTAWLVRTSSGGAELAHAQCHARSEEHTSELQSQSNLVCRLLLEKKTKIYQRRSSTLISHSVYTNTSTPLI